MDFAGSNPCYLEANVKIYHGGIMGIHLPKKCLPPQTPSFLIIMGSEMLRVFKGPKLETTAGPFSLKTSAMAVATRR